MNSEECSNETLKNERIETLMLMSILAHEPYRSQAGKELKRRRIVISQEQLFDAFMLFS